MHVGLTSNRVVSLNLQRDQKALPCALQIWNAAAQESSSGPASRLHSALMAVLTHMVGRLGSLAIQDPHIQGVLYALLQKGLEGSSAEQEVRL